MAETPDCCHWHRECWQWLVLQLIWLLRLSQLQWPETRTYQFYRPPTKLYEGNVFSRVCVAFCLSMRGGLPCDHYPHGYPRPHHTRMPLVSSYRNLTPSQDRLESWWLALDWKSFLCLKFSVNYTRQKKRSFKYSFVLSSLRSENI